ncbi:dihydroxyacetone kinase subunit K [Alkalihalobacillus alcalophilus ATCC 27647 = CGMCC 1.3604]|uniref:Dihydroxyacetone kinase n=1 Tax=Alkalihalobacillus alcalophilus ATCC 27647 = CGMCC 1.3604 TaxID=1218173 RepID=A0A094WSB7_ALKAL|nr:dihydroxyacetone kinase subunit DhaK [Alkalihalobacillus alcalophilus]KGA98953.1 dihydroxyacetone kinase [Alkalihalobacillus alcalophilus ATCC 27647 = CGMCC 1.3604]MED1561988.1 dihydroxyacetone kinase subunit DhaK [Alkalihalobacillus alcalophilus]THG89136.1 dihydroxyacetone kinase subunit K [Alkalihalobacillus alcalophilus ATCC 27647 = CGMCC 1.3604]
MKKILNDVEAVVDEMLEGMVAAHPDRLRRLKGTTVLVRKEAPVNGKVGIVSGGGSGHEPAHGGFVGEGMLDAAVAGEVFTSPTPDQIYEAIKAVHGGKGVLLIIKNYTGDVMNFEMAAEMAEIDGIKVRQVIVNDDVAVEDSSFTSGRRGIAGTVLVHKIAGALAANGASLEQVESVANKVIQNVKSMGMSLTPCTVPASGKPGFQLAENEIEIGTGIHGEPGVERTKILTAKELAEVLFQKVNNDLNLQEREEVAILVNGLGATPLMELYVLHYNLKALLDKKKLQVVDTIVGEWMTSLEMSGVSITILRLDDQLKTLLKQEADTVAFKR